MTRAQLIAKLKDLKAKKLTNVSLKSATTVLQAEYTRIIKKNPSFIMPDSVRIPSLDEEEADLERVIKKYITDYTKWIKKRGKVFF